MDSDILQLLTEKQRRAWIDLLGKPIDRPEAILQVVVSPDGSKIAFAGTRTSYGNYIGIVDRDGTHRRTLIDDGELVGHPRFSPDGRRLLFRTSAGGRWALAVMDLDGRARTRLDTGHWEPYFGGSFSPDRRRVAFSTYSQGCAVLDLNSGQCRPLDRFGTGPVYSRDGRTIICENEPDKFEKIVRGGMWLADGDGARATDLPVIGYNPVFGRDGRIIFLSGEDGRQDVWSMKPDGSDQHQLTKTGGIKRSLSAAAGVDVVIFLQQSGKCEPRQLFEMRPDGTGLKRLAILR